ncbi:hypothetical protein H0R92_12640 [Treponema sp. OMZ 840]|uniref:sodium:solute symporter family transporter n=1 Tax=Treponema sp. OMZ 840 TaxID=244313 RepID=UPI003D8E3A70
MICFKYNKTKVKITEKNINTISRVVILALGIGSVLLAIKPPDLIFTLIMFSIALVMPLFPTLIFAIYWKRGTTPAAISSSILGVITVLITYYFGYGNTWYGAFGMLVSILVFVVVSLLTKDDSAEGSDFYKALDTGMNKYYNLHVD